ncbi:hypothetical protein EJB05_33717, partial [Eragrostis curvula]
MSSTLANVTVDDADALDCGVCFLPLKLPIFQCKVGHMVCSPCRDKLEATGKCHVCGIAAHGGVRACPLPARRPRLRRHAGVPRPRRPRRRVRARAVPCRCPDDACRFAASTAAHGWPCATKTSVGDIVGFTVELQDGFNFVRATAGGGAKKTQSSYLFLLNMVTEDAGCAVSVLCIHPHAMTDMKFELEYSRYVDVRRRDGNQLVNHYQKSEFRVVCTDLSDGLPDPSDGFRFVVPWSVLGDDEDDTIQVTASAYTVISC